MKVHWPVEILGTGAALPKRVVTNDEFTARLDTSDEWIVARTGIRERRFTGEGESTRTLGTAASREALVQAGIGADELDLIVCGTVTPEYYLPATACGIQHDLGAGRIPAFDISASCAGFLYSLITGAQFIQGGMARTVLVVGSDTLSSITNMEDRTTCILFGDGAAAAIIRTADDPDKGILAVCAMADGKLERLIWVPAGGSREPASHRTVNERLHYLRMNGREVYKFAVVQMQEMIGQTLADAGATLDDLALLVPHQSNLRIIESACSKLGVPREKVMVNIDRYGNTSGGSVPIALHEARLAGRVRSGDLVMMLALGAGLVWASVLMRV